MISYDFTKSILADCELLQFRPSLVVASLITAVVELHLKQECTPSQIKTKNIQPVVLFELRILNQLWDGIVSMIFGESSMPHLEQFGKYLVSRQQYQYKLLRVKKVVPDFRPADIYKARVQAYMDSFIFDEVTISGKTSAFKNAELDHKYATALHWVRKVQQPQM